MWELAIMERERTQILGCIANSSIHAYPLHSAECNPDHHSCVGVPHPEWTNAGALAIVRADLPADGTPKTLGVVSPSNIVWPGCDGPAPSTAAEWGAADPRLTYRPKTETYYLTWDNCTRNCEPERSTLLSTTTNPHDPDSWTLHGAVLPGKYTGGAALLFRDDAVGDGNTGGPQHYAFVSDSNTAGSIILATSDNGLAWTEAGIFMAARTGCWDEAGVAVGPHPVRLSTGDYLMICESRREPQSRRLFDHPPSLSSCNLAQCSIRWERECGVVERTRVCGLTP